MSFRLGKTRFGRTSSPKVCVVSTCWHDAEYVSGGSSYDVVDPSQDNTDSCPRDMMTQMTHIYIYNVVFCDISYDVCMCNSNSNNNDNNTSYINVYIVYNIYIVSFHSEVPDSPLAKRHGEDLGEITNHQDVSNVRWKHAVLERHSFYKSVSHHIHGIPFITGTLW